MAVPTLYTDDTYALYLHSVLDGVNDVLGYSIAAGSYDEIINDVLITLSHTSLATITDIRGLRATGRYYAWKRAADKAATLYDFAVDKRSFKRNQMAEYIYKNLAAAENDPYVTIGSNDAGSIVNISAKNIKRAITNDRYTAGGLHWQYTDEWPANEHVDTITLFLGIMPV